MMQALCGQPNEPSWFSQPGAAPGTHPRRLPQGRRGKGQPGAGADQNAAAATGRGSGWFPAVAELLSRALRLPSVQAGLGESRHRAQK